MEKKHESLKDEEKAYEWDSKWKNDVQIENNRRVKITA